MLILRLSAVLNQPRLIPNYVSPTHYQWVHCLVPQN